MQNPVSAGTVTMTALSQLLCKKKALPRAALSAFFAALVLNMLFTKINADLHTPHAPQLAL